MHETIAIAAARTRNRSAESCEYLFKNGKSLIEQNKRFLARKFKAGNLVNIEAKARAAWLALSAWQELKAEHNSRVALSIAKYKNAQLPRSCDGCRDKIDDTCDAIPRAPCHCSGRKRSASP